MRNLLAIALFLLLPLSASGAESAAPPAAAPVAPAVVPTPEAAPHSFTAIAAPDKVKLGQTFVYTIEVRHSKDERYELPKDLFLGDEFNVIKIEPFRTTQGDDAITRFAITAALFDLGEKKIPDVKLAATTPRGQAQLTIPGPPVTGGGELKEEEEGKLFDIMPPVDVKVPRYTALYIIAGTILATLLALLLLRWWRNRPLKTVVVKQVPRLPAHERALAALAQL